MDRIQFGYLSQGQNLPLTIFDPILSDAPNKSAGTFFSNIWKQKDVHILFIYWNLR